MKKFTNKTNQGNEKAIRRGIRVPDGDVNIAWVKAPSINPKDNLVVVDTANITPENVTSGAKKCRIMYANELGILEDENGNQSFFEEYPSIADVFSVDENFSADSALNEYTVDSILPYVHISRHFHVDFNGLATENTITTINLKSVKVVDNNGKEYVDDKGRKKYRIALSKAANTTSPTQAAYRIYAYVDTDDNENLFLLYNKVDVGTDGEFKNQDVDFTETLNPIPYFKYVPEESDVVDPSNLKEKIYTTKPLNIKNQILGVPSQGPDGYRVFVPKKAIPDPRQFQLFRWRVACDFVESVKIDPTANTSVIRCASVYTTEGSPTTEVAPYPYSFINMEKSEYNSGGYKFINPVAEDLPPDPTDTDEVDPRYTAAYWSINFSTISNSDLKKFDILVWHPESTSFDFTPYMPKIDYFCRVLGRTLIIECGNRAVPTGLNVTITDQVDPVSGDIRIAKSSGAPSGTYVYGDTMWPFPADGSDILVNSNEDLGGWDLNPDNTNWYESLSHNLYPDAYKSVHPAMAQNQDRWLTGRGKMAYFSQYPSSSAGEWHAFWTAEDRYGIRYQPIALRRDFSESKGALFISLMDIPPTDIVDADTGQQVSENTGAYTWGAILNTDNTSRLDEWVANTSGFAVEGQYKLFYNICLYSTRARTVDNSDEQLTSSKWTQYSDWYPSWVIDGSVLSQKEIESNQFIQRAKSRQDPTVVWQRRLEIPSENGRTTTKTFKQLIDDKLGDRVSLLSRSRRTYRLEITNSKVTHIDTTDSNVFDENDPPYVWTDEKSPAFTVPREIGAHVVREKLVQGEYRDANYIARTYPNKKYGFRVSAIYTQDAQLIEDIDINWTATGTATETIGYTDRSIATWSTHGLGLIRDIGPLNPPYSLGDPIARGIDTFSGSNYYEYHANHQFADPGIYGRWEMGSSGDIIRFFQNMINLFIDFALMPGPKISPVSGYFGSQTKDAVIRLQTQFKAFSRDGIIDSETLGIIGHQINRLNDLWVQFQGTNIPYPDAQQVLRYMSFPNMSNRDNDKVYSKKSYFGTQLPLVWDVYQVAINRVAKIYGVTVIPYVAGSAGTVRVAAVDVINGNLLPAGAPYYEVPGQRNLTPDLYTMMHHYPSDLMLPVDRLARDGEQVFMPIWPRYANMAAVKLVQDKLMGLGWCMQIGVRDIWLHIEDDSTFTQTVDIEYSGSLTLRAGKPQVFFFNPTYSGPGNLTNINWTSVTTDQPDKVNSWLWSFGAVVFTSLQIDNEIWNSVSMGPYVGGTLMASGTLAQTPPSNFDHTSDYFPGNPARFYSMDENGTLFPYLESGFINKTDGVKLFVNESGEPYGFPDLDRINYAEPEYSIHYTKFRVENFDTDPEVMVGFYDNAQKEFIVSEEGVPEISYIDWIERGPHNVFLAAVTDAEVQVSQKIPDNGGPQLPQRVAMPVYGVCSKGGGSISIGSLPDNLGMTDLWPIPIKTGKFQRSITLPSKFENPVVKPEWLLEYAGQTLTAYYGVPEADSAGWSAIYGRPYSDIKDETPLVLDDTHIQVRQAPVLMIKTPTAFGQASDPVRPVITIYTRETILSSWQELGWEDIRDYNVSTGIFELVDPLRSADSSLVKVDYTTSRSDFMLKQVDGQDINLNPYLNKETNLLGKAIYVYVLPEMVKDIHDVVIEDSIRTSTLGWTTDPSMFNSNSPNYNALAVLLGIIFISNSLDIKDLYMIDTRRRGGGARDSVKLSYLEKTFSEASSYWDLAFGAGTTYQKGGFILIRLPRELKDAFPDPDDILNIVERNITAGVQYKIEDLQGREW